MNKTGEKHEKRGASFEERRKRRIARRRSEILAAAARVFADKGYDNTTTWEIAAAADVAEGTLYNYFGGKREILLAIAHEGQSPIDGLLKDVDKLRGRKDMVVLVERGLDLFMSQLTFTRTLLLEAWLDDVILQDFVLDRFQRVNDLLETFIAARIEEGDFRAVDPGLTTRMVVGMFIAGILPVLRGVASPPSEEERRALSEAIVDLLLDGIRVRVD
ncbi:MAG TPA: TetR/AcrR family transcriptional regulator [Chloroflexi bacterium]|nr:TetR/AcrR family transcriptional regulator [Chloroflexota bacterium]